MTATHMSLIYKQSPLAIKALMDRAFSEQKKSTDLEHDVIYTDFGYAENQMKYAYSR